MEVVIDGVIYQLQAYGGISRLYSEILPRMCELDDSLQLSLLTKGQLKQPLPEHPRIKHLAIPLINRYLRPGRMWKPIVLLAERFVRQLWIGRGKGKIWHSTYYTMPEKWEGSMVITVVDMIPERFAGLFNGPENNQFREQKRLCVQEADAVICISETTRQDVRRFYGLNTDSICVVPLACSDVFRQLEHCEVGLKMPIRKPFLLYVGIRAHYKNSDALIQAYSIWSQRKDVALVFVGKPWLADEENHLAALGIQDWVHLLTDTDDETLCHLYNQAAAFVFPSFYEGFGMPLLEAMACGCPIIASHIPSTIEVAGDCPIYFEPTEVDDLVRAFNVALSEGRSTECVQAGLKRVKSYSWDKTATKILEVYREVSTLNKFRFAGCFRC